ncbi:hypothetical protein FA13DRAFT_1167449 [Coprinellus micaceus]|uniref:Uncharacterized protein n=1 Tax=Coprinellus micaceus TaxID=71717 RepID=A0A4Y7SU49_COPMI|nr:hypothetical protein FA13DRAFT_1167449 [Coprinellus micaceus]
MSSTSSLTMAAATPPPISSALPLAEAASQLSAALTKIYPYVKTTTLLALDVAKASWAFSQRFMIHPIPIVLYIIAPLTVFVGYLASIFVFMPYATLVYLLEALHPLYVFCGVACLTGALLGVVGRLVAWLVVASVVPEAETIRTKTKKAVWKMKEEI